MKKIYFIGLLSLFFSSASAAPVAGDYRSDLLTGDWGNTLTWLKFNGVLWLTDLSYPGQNAGTGNVEITTGRTVTLNVTPAYPIASLTITSGTLSYNSTPGRTLSVTGNVVFAGSGNMSVVNATGTNIHTLNIGGSVTMANGTAIDMSNGEDVANVVMNGTGNQSITINGTSVTAKFYDLTINKSTASTTITSSVTPFLVKHDLNVTSGNLILEATADLPYTVQNNVTVSSGSKLTHNISYNNANKIFFIGGDLALAGNYVYTGYTPAVCMNGTGNRLINTGSTSLSKLFLLNGDFKANGNVTIDADFYAMWDNNAGSFHTNGQTVSAAWGLVNSGGTLYIDGGSLTVGTTAGGLLVGRTNGVNGNVIMSSGNLISPNIYLGNATSAPPTTTAGFNLSGGTITSSLIDLGYSATFTKSGGSDDVATLQLRAGTSNYNNVPSGATTFKITDFTNNGTYTAGANATIEVAGQWINNNIFNASTGSTVIFKGTAAQTIGGTATSNFNNLVIQPSAAVTVTAGNNISLNGDLTITSGTFDLSTYNCNRATSGGTLSLAAGATLSMSGTSGGACSTNNFPANFTTINFDPASIAVYAATSNQQICSAPVYGHLQLKNAGTKLASSGTISIKGNFTNTAPSVFAHNNGTISMEGTNQDLAGVGYFNLSLKNGGTKTLTAAGSVAKELNIGAATTFALVNNNLTLVSSASNTANVATMPSNAAITYGTGRFVVERYINTGLSAGQHKKSWQLVSTPASGQTIYQSWQENGSTAAGFGTWITGPGAGVDAYSAGPSLKYYDPATDYYVGVANTNAPVANSNGYFLYVRGDRTVSGSANPVPTKLRMTGKIYQPNDAPPGVTVTKGKYASIGNPYASAIDISYMKNNSLFTDLNRDVIVWDPSIGGTYGYGGWQTLSAANNYEPVTGGLPGSMYPAGISSPYIQSGQAFFVHSANGATVNGSLSFNENVKASGSKLVTRGGISQRQFLRVTMYSNEELLDGNAVAFDNQFINDVDPDDALKIPNSGENIGLSRSGKLLAVEARTGIESTDTVFYQLTNLRQQNYQLRFAPKDIDENITIVLKDRFLGNSTVLSNSDSSFVDFTITAASASSAADRFYVVFTVTKVLPLTITSVSADKKATGAVLVKWQVENETNISKYVVERSSNGTAFDNIVGSLSASNAGNYQVSDEHPGTGDRFYRIKITDINGKISYRQVVKIAGSAATTSMNIFPNPVEGKTAHLSFMNCAKGNYEIVVLHSGGQKIYSASQFISGSVMNVSVKLPENTPAGNYQIVIISDNAKKTILRAVVL